MIFTERQQVKKLGSSDLSFSIIAGAVPAGNADWPADCASFTQLQGVYSEGNNVYVTDVATGSVKLITEHS